MDVHARRRMRYQAGRTVRQTRTALGWRQQDLGDQAGVSRSMVARVELGTANVTLDVLADLYAALGIEPHLAASAPFLADRRRQREPAHVRCAAYVQRMLEAAGWLTAREVEIIDGRYRGWIDLLAFDPRSESLIVIEIKTEIEDLGRIERTLGWYERHAWAAARRLGWHPRRVRSWLLVLATEANERRAADNRDALATGFPDRAPGMLTSPTGTRAVAMIDPRSRRRAWLRRCRVDGRRSPAPYADYADFMNRTRSRSAGATRRPKPTQPALA